MEVFLQLSLANSSCYSMQCNNNQISMPKGSCTYLANNTMYLEPCPNYYSCQIGFEISYCIPDFETPSGLSYPGEPCTKISDCKYGNCKYGYCQGQQERQSCFLSAECAPSLYCKAGVCTAQIGKGKTGCTQDFECVNSAGCLDGTCVAYFSLNVGDFVPTCPSQFSLFCSTGTCWNNACIQSIVSNNTLPTPCTSYQDCYSGLSSDGMIFYSDCVCGNNPQGLSYCSLFTGDDFYSLFISSFSNWLSSEVSGLCNTERRFDFACIGMFWDTPNYQELFLYFYKYRWYPLIQNNDECIMDIYTAEYWDLIDEITFAGNLKFASLILLIFS